MNIYISVNIISQALILMNCIQKNHCKSIQEASQIKLPFGVTFDTSIAFAKQCEWINSSDSNIKYTEMGNKIISLFNGDFISKPLWCLILSRYISICQPVWAKRIPYGRQEAFIYMSEEEQRCFIEAGLIESQEDDVIQWWDSLADIERKRQNIITTELGRKGERLTLLYEERRTGEKPDWRSIETNVAGYDIMSQRSESNKEKLLIEVKTSTMPVESAVAIISRHEWNIATLENNKKRYFFYFWIINGSQLKLAIIDVDTMAPHMPIDGDTGNWENTKIPFSAFISKFNNTNL